MGLKEGLSKPPRLSRVGLGLSGIMLMGAGLWLVAVELNFVATLVLAAGLVGFGLFNLVSGFRKNLTFSRANQLSLIGNLILFISLYVVISRLLVVSYTTDTVVGTYMGVLRALQLQSPYGFSIKPLLDKFGFSPSFYTPGVDGSFDFHLAYPSLSFLSVVPFYLLGLHDVRDTVFIFHIMSVLTIFALAPARLKSVSVLPFTLFSVVIAGSWTDSVWAFFLVLTAVLWYRHPKASWVSLGLSIAVKQIAIVIAPFLLIRVWKETPHSGLRTLAKDAGLMLSAFFLPNLPFIISTPGSWWSKFQAWVYDETPKHSLAASNRNITQDLASPADTVLDDSDDADRDFCRSVWSLHNSSFESAYLDPDQRHNGPGQHWGSNYNQRDRYEHALDTSIAYLLCQV